MNISLNISRSKPKAEPITGRSLKPVMETVTPAHMKMLRAMDELIQGFNRGTGEADFDRFKRSYDAAGTDEYNADLRGTYGSANSEILQSDYVSRARTRTLAKDKAHGRAIELAFQNNVVGSEGFKLEMKISEKQDVKNKKRTNPDGTINADEPETRKKQVEDTERNGWIEDAWRDFCKKENFTITGLSDAMESWRMVEGSRVRDGNVLCILHPEFDLNEFHFALEFTEWDRLQSAYQGMDDEGNPIRWSVSWHPKWKRPLYYWILTRHPGEVFGITGYFPQSKLGNPEFYRAKVPASRVVPFCNLRNRAEQDIGMTELTPTLMPIWRSEQFAKALALASIASSAKPWWIEKDFTGLQLPEAMREQFSNTPGLDGEIPMDVPGTGASNEDAVQSQQGSGQPINVVKPAARETLSPGFHLKQADPKFPIESAHEYQLDNWREIAVGTGLAYQHISGDFQNLGFIAGLMCMVPAQENFKVRQNSFIADVKIIFREWLRAAILSGYFDKRGQDIPMSRLDEFCRAAHFKGKRWPFVNPLVQAQALILLNEGGHMTRQQVQDELPSGMSFDKLVQEFENENDLIDEHGLDWNDVDVTRPTISKGNPNQTVPAAGDQPPGKGAAAVTKTPNPVRGLSQRSRLLISDTIEKEIQKILDEPATNGNGRH